MILILPVVSVRHKSELIYVLSMNFVSHNDVFELISFELLRASVNYIIRPFFLYFFILLLYLQIQLESFKMCCRNFVRPIQHKNSSQMGYV